MICWRMLESVGKWIAEVEEMVSKKKFKVIGVIYQNWEAYDGRKWVRGIPEEIH